MINMNNFIKFVFRHRNLINYTECKRFAGHNKWSNIRHIKMEKDLEKQVILQLYIKKMRIAIAEGKSCNPEQNTRLAKLIEQAKEKSLPLSTIKNFIEKIEKSQIKTQTAVFETKGPSGCVVLIQLLSDNIVHARNLLNNHLKKAQFTTSETSLAIFERKGIILTEIGDRNLDKALDDAIESGAEEVEALKENDNEFFQFSCGINEVYKVKSKLETLNYKILQADIEFIPKVCVTLTEKEMEHVNKLYERLKNVEEVARIYTNVV